MKYLILAIITATLLSGCSEEQYSSLGRAINGAASGYYRQPGYYPQQTTVVQPVQPIYPY